MDSSQSSPCARLYVWIWRCFRVFLVSGPLLVGVLVVVVTGIICIPQMLNSRAKIIDQSHPKTVSDFLHVLSWDWQFQNAVCALGFVQRSWTKSSTTYLLHVLTRILSVLFFGINKCAKLEISALCTGMRFCLCYSVVLLDTHSGCAQSAGKCRCILTDNMTYLL